MVCAGGTVLVYDVRTGGHALTGRGVSSVQTLEVALIATAWFETTDFARLRKTLQERAHCLPVHTGRRCG